MAESVDRMKSYKNMGKDTAEMRRKRTELSVELRKVKKDDRLSKRRNMAMVGAISDEECSPLANVTNVCEPVQTKYMVTVAEIKDCMLHEDASQQMLGVVSCRKVLSREKSPLITDVIEAGLLPLLVSFLERDDSEQLQFEAAWALTNVASGNTEQTRAVVKAGAVSHLINLLPSHNHCLVEQAVWALGNIAGDGPDLRDLILSYDVYDPLLKIVLANISVSFMRNLAWTLSNLVRNTNPPVSLEAARRIVPIFSKILSHSDSAVISDATWGLSYLTSASAEYVQLVIDSGFLPFLVDKLRSTKPDTIIPSLRSVGNVLTGTDVHTQMVLDCGALPLLGQLLKHDQLNIRKETAWALSNVTAGTVTQIQMIIDSDILPSLVDSLKNGDYKTAKEAGWAIANITFGGTAQQVSELIAHDTVSAICAILERADDQFLIILLDAVAKILELAKHHSQLEAVSLRIEECGGLDIIENLQRHQNNCVYKKAASLIDDFFCGEEEDEDVAPAQSAGDFAFSAGSASTTANGGFTF